VKTSSAPNFGEFERIDAVRKILKVLYELPSDFPQSGINRIERETIFFSYENVDHKLAERRPHSLRARRMRGPSAKSLNRFLTYDHAIPLRTLRAGFRAAASTHDALTAFFRRYVRSAIITKEEDQLLTNELWRSAMPKDARADDPMACYRAVGIAFEPNDEGLLLKPHF
jgi:hypothetical protein